MIELYRVEDGKPVNCMPEQREVLLKSKLYSAEKPELIEEKDQKDEKHKTNHKK